MWWEPQTKHEELLQNAVKQLRIWFREQVLQETPIAFGIGSFWIEHMSKMVPLVLLNSEIFPFPYEIKLRSEELDMLPSMLPIPVPRIKELPRIDSELPIFFMVVTRPRPSSKADEILSKFLPVWSPIICGRTGELGTAGVAVWDENNFEYGLLTAGHVFPEGKNSPVLRLPRILMLFPKLRRILMLFPRKNSFGYVRHHIEPKGPNPGWDAAVITTSQTIRTRYLRTRGLVKRIEQTEPIITHGAYSGTVREAAVAKGALEEVGTNKMMWTHCWMIGPSGVLTSGDSGAAVFTRNDANFLGVYVGSSIFKSTGKSFFHYVQDAHSLYIHQLKKWGIRFNKEAI